MDIENDNANETEEKNKKRNSDNIDLRKFIAIIIPVAASSILALAFAISVFVHPDQRYVDGSLGIISLAVAVWTGINIANVIEKKEVEKIRLKLKKAEKKIEESKIVLGNSKKILKSLEDYKQLREELDRKEFYYVLESSDDIFYRYLRDMFKDDKQTIPSEYNADTLRIIKGILHIKYLYLIDNADTHKYTSMYSEEVIDRIEELAEKIPEGLTKNVLYYIRSEALFYSAVAICKMQRNPNEFQLAAERFYNAAKGYENLTTCFVDRAPSIVKLNYYNTVGQCYSEMIFCYVRFKRNGASSREFDDLIDSSNAKYMVKKFSDLAIADKTLEEYPYLFERFFRNAGVAKERVAMVSNENIILDLKHAINDYEKASKYSKQDKTGYVTCSAYNKLIKAMIHANKSDNQDFITSSSEESLWQMGRVDNDCIESFKNACIKLRGFSNMWRQMRPDQTNYYCLYLLSLLYEGIIVDNVQKKLILNSVRHDVEEINCIPKDVQTELHKVVVNVFANIDKSFLEVSQ